MRKTILFVTHDIDEAIRLGDKICLMRDGAVVQYADPDTMLRQPADAFVAQFFGQEPALRRLARHSVADFVRTDAASLAAAAKALNEGAASVTLTTGARTALSKLLDGQPLLPVVDHAGAVAGLVALADLTLAQTPRCRIASIVCWQHDTLAHRSGAGAAMLAGVMAGLSSRRLVARGTGAIGRTRPAGAV
jgi:osmoprotectant transport system ATP-binding protein